MKTTMMTTKTKKKMATTNRVRDLLIVSGVVLFAFTSLINAAPRPASAAQDKLDLAKDYALIVGTVWGPDKRPVFGVPVKIRRADDKKARWERVSDHLGEFAVRVPTGKTDYVVWADIKVPKGKEQPQTKVHVENDERVDISLRLSE